MATRRDFLTQTAVASLAVAASAQFGRAVAQDRGGGSKAPLKTYKIPHTDLVVSRLGFGCGMLGLDWKDADFVAKTVRIINTAYEQGITFFDLADTYGNGKAEMALGEVLKQHPGMRHKIVIQTKCGERLGYIDNSRAHIMNSVEGSLKRLGTDHLDVLLLHWPDSLVRPEEVAEAFDELKRSGKVRYFGVSNHSPMQIELLKKHLHQPLVINQIQLGLAHWYVMHERPKSPKSSLMHGDEAVVTLDYCRVHEMQVQAYSPLKAARIGKPPNLLKPAEDASAEVKRVTQMLADLGKKNDAGPAAIMLAWLLQHPAGIVPIIGATKTEYVVENCAADRIEFSREEWYSLLYAAAAIEPTRPT